VVGERQMIVLWIIVGLVVSYFGIGILLVVGALVQDYMKGMITKDMLTWGSAWKGFRLLIVFWPVILYHYIKRRQGLK